MQNKSVTSLQTPESTIKEYIDKTKLVFSLKNKKRKIVQKQIQDIEENNKFLKQDSEIYLTKIKHLKRYIFLNIKSIPLILIEFLLLTKLFLSKLLSPKM